MKSQYKNTDVKPVSKNPTRPCCCRFFTYFSLHLFKPTLKSMKRKAFFLAVCLAMLCPELRAQAVDDQDIFGFAKGDITATGSLSYSNTKFITTKSRSFSVEPFASYFISDHWAINAGFVLESSKSEFGTNEFETRGRGIRLGSSYYFTPANRFSFTVGLNGTYYANDSESNNFEAYEFNSFTLSLAPGVTYFIANNVIFSVNLGAATLYTDNNNSTTQNRAEINRRTLDIDLSNVAIGVSIRF